MAQRVPSPLVSPTVFELIVIGSEIKTEDSISCQWVECPQTAGTELTAAQRIPIKNKLGYCKISVEDVMSAGLSIAQVGSDRCHYGIIGLRDMAPAQRLLHEIELARRSSNAGGALRI